MISFDEFLGLALYSDNAVKHNIDNIPTPQHRDNLLIVYNTIYLPLSKKFDGHVKINSGYRSKSLNDITPNASLTSEHCLGMALDLVGINPITNKTIFDWLRVNVKFHQLIWERGTDTNPAWVHIGYNPSKLVCQVEKCIIENGKPKYLPF